MSRAAGSELNAADVDGHMGIVESQPPCGLLAAGRVPPPAHPPTGSCARRPALRGTIRGSAAPRSPGPPCLHGCSRAAGRGVKIGGTPAGKPSPQEGSTRRSGVRAATCRRHRALSTPAGETRSIRSPCSFRARRAGEARLSHVPRVPPIARDARGGMLEHHAHPVALAEQLLRVRVAAALAQIRDRSRRSPPRRHGSPRATAGCRSRRRRSS